MTIYISQGRYTAAAINGMSAKPEDRSEGVAELFAAAGARLISCYLTLGLYDWLIIAEAPDEPTMISAVLAAADKANKRLSPISGTLLRLAGRGRRIADATRNECPLLADSVEKGGCCDAEISVIQSV